jgi:hypothetical protein
VIQRVAKRSGPVVESAVGSWAAAVMTKSRTWSRAINAITSPRRMSMDDRRYERRSDGPAAAVEWIGFKGVLTRGESR